MIRLTVTIGLLAGLLSLSACTLLPESEPVAVYQFPQPSLAGNTQNDPLYLSLRIDTPHAGYAHTSPRLIVQSEDNQLLGYKGIRWSDPTPMLLREYVALAFQRHGALGNVTTDENSLHSDVHLSSDLRRFQIVAGGEPHILIELHVRLVNPESRRTYVSHDFKVQQPITSTSVQPVMDGYAQASATLAAQLIDWAIPQLASIAQN